MPLPVVVVIAVVVVVVADVVVHWPPSPSWLGLDCEVNKGAVGGQLKKLPTADKRDLNAAAVAVAVAVAVAAADVAALLCALGKTRSLRWHITWH